MTTLVDEARAVCPFGCFGGRQRVEAVEQELLVNGSTSAAMQRVAL